MPSFNKVILMGNLTRDPELKYTPKGTAIADIGLAINRTWKNDAGERQEDCTFVNVTLWGRTAEIVGEYCKKGDPLHVEGRLQLDQWDDRQTGQKRSALKVIGEHIQLIASKGSGRREEGAGGRQEPQQGSRGSRAGQTPPRGAQRSPADPDLDAPEEDIPFS